VLACVGLSLFTTRMSLLLADILVSNVHRTIDLSIRPVVGDPL
jgi:hypothetical protein